MAKFNKGYERTITKIDYWRIHSELFVKARVNVILRFMQTTLGKILIKVVLEFLLVILIVVYWSFWVHVAVSCFEIIT